MWPCCFTFTFSHVSSIASIQALMCHCLLILNQSFVLIIIVNTGNSNKNNGSPNTPSNNPISRPIVTASIVVSMRTWITNKYPVKTFNACSIEATTIKIYYNCFEFYLLWCIFCIWVILLMFDVNSMLTIATTKYETFFWKNRNTTHTW